MKKLLGIAVAAIMVMAFSVKASASVPCFRNCGPKPTPTPTMDIKVVNSFTDVTTVAKVDVNTGDNMQMGGTFSKMRTGGVVGAVATADSYVNMTTLPSCNCSKIGDISVTNMFTDVATIAKVDVKTGDNSQMSFGKFTMPSMTTGHVKNVGVESNSMVNYVDFSVDVPLN